MPFWNLESGEMLYDLQTQETKYFIPLTGSEEVKLEVTCNGESWVIICTDTQVNIGVGC